MNGYVFPASIGDSSPALGRPEKGADISHRLVSERNCPADGGRREEGRGEGRGGWEGEGRG